MHRPFFSACLLRTLLAGGLLALISGCVSSRMFRADSLDRQPLYSLSFVEFDDQGELWSPAQLETALDNIRDESRTDDGAIVVVFIHGWNHNAAPREDTRKHGSVRGFRRILELIGQDESKQIDRPPRPVVGVYVGWRGRNVSTPLLWPFSFFNRRAAATRIAGPSATEVIYRVATVAKENRRSKVVFLGHSFGGLILERAVTQAMIGSLLAAATRNEPFPADAIILLNPASQSLYAKQFIEALDRNRIKLYRSDPSGELYERPLVVSVTSEGDKVGRFLFPLGLGARSLFKKFRKYDDPCTPIGRQRPFFMRTAGHNDVLLSHLVTVDDRRADSSAGEETGLEDTFGAVQTRYDPVTTQRVFTFRGQQHDFTIKKRPRAVNDSAYWIMRVPSELIPNHSSIFEVDTVRLIGAIMSITGALERDSRTEIVRDLGLHPVELVVRPNGGLIILDRDRRVYMVDGDSEPRSPGCIPHVVDASDRIALAFDGRGGHAVINRPAKRGAFRTEVLDIELTATGPRIAGRTELEGNRRFVAAAFDFSRDRVFLAAEKAGEIYAVDLGQRHREPWLLARLEVSGPLNVLGFDPRLQGLFAADGESGVLFSIDARDEEGVAQIVAEGIGSPASLDIDSERGVVYVVDARNRTVLKLACKERDACSRPTPLLAEERLQNPSFVRVAPDGTVWLAGLEDQIVLSVAPDSGTVLRVFRSD